MTVDRSQRSSYAETEAMPVHDWKRVKPGIFHHFHHGWIEEVTRALNRGLLPDEYYAMAEQQAAGFGPDVLTLQTRLPDTDPLLGGTAATGTLVRPHSRFTSETEGEFYRRKKSSVVVRHVSDDRMVAMLEIVSPGNKATRKAFRAFLDKVCDLLEYKIHLLIVDLLPSTRRAPNGIHAAIWQELVDEADFHPPADKPLTLVAYESDLVVKAFVEPVAVGDVLPMMPLILEPGWAVEVPLEQTYQAAWDAVPRRWQQVLAD
jgi:Protein of unknown function (DUF4058)